MNGQCVEEKLAQDRPGYEPRDTDLQLRLELLRHRAELDRIAQELGLIDALHDAAHVDGIGLGVAGAVRRAVEESRELRRVKSSLRYRAASLLADVGQKPIRIARRLSHILRRAISALRKAKECAWAANGKAPRTMGAGEEAEAVKASLVPPPAPTTARDLTIAAVLDPFSTACFSAECQIISLDPEKWFEQVRRNPPHFLLVESAWSGVSGEWKGGVERGAQPIRSLVAAFRSAGIPTVFWNKEDPLHFGAFLDTASLFDHVLTTDADCIPRYRRLLGHDRVGVMPFAVQPSIHHPVCRRPRARSSVFAGAWYGRLPQRARDFVSLADALALAGELLIHDRLDGRGAPYQRFPARYRKMLRPAIDYGSTGEVFRQHLLGLNLNTIKSSPTMFARRALELAASGTSVYGNHAVGLHIMLGDSVVATDNAPRLLAHAWRELRSPNAKIYRLRRLRALRSVMAGHTWAHRLRQVVQIAMGINLPPACPTFNVVARVASRQELDRICAAFERQVMAGSRLVLDAPEDLELPDHVHRLQEAVVPSTDWVAMFHVDDYYGPHYLVDMAHATYWKLSDRIGKAAWHSFRGGAVTEHNPKLEYSFVETLALRRMVFLRSAVDTPLHELLDDIDSGSLAGAPCISINAWEYLESGAESSARAYTDVSWPQVVSADDVVRMAALLPPQPEPGQAKSNAIDGPALARLFARGVHEKVSVTARRGRMELCSVLESAQTASISSELLPRDRMETAGRLQLCLQGQSSSATTMHIEIVGARQQILGSIRLDPLSPINEVPLLDARAYRLTITVQGPIVQEIDGLWVGKVPAQPLFAPGRGRLAVVCNGYPHDDDLYRNGFIHRRVLGYRGRGVGVDVFVVKGHGPLRDYEYEGVLVRECSADTLAATLAISGHHAIAVHFLDESIWRAVQVVPRHTEIVVWVHGAEVQSWRHRSMNYASAEERRFAQSLSEQRSTFWKDVLSNATRPVKYIFVSRQLAEQTWSDLGVRPPQETWSVIHNPIDIRLFRYCKKPRSFSRKILSIRPHASKIYANDLVAAAIRELAGHELFSELSFTLVGDGPLWDQNFAGLERYPNVHLVRGFLSQDSIASLHRNHGVFLVPTRGDTQGVSRDEAMASGLVPVTTMVGAVPEFVDASCGELCPPDDAGALAAAILRLATDPDRFALMSARAAERAARQSGIDQVVNRELTALGVARRTDADLHAADSLPTRTDPVQ